MKKLLILLHLTLTLTYTYSQSDSIPSLTLTGSIQNNTTGSKIDGVKIITINRQNDTVNIQFTSKNGKYRIQDLDSGYVYFIWYTKPGFFTKIIQIDLTELTSKYNKTQIDSFNADLSLIENGYHDCNLYFDELEKKPIAKAKYVLHLNDVEWDMSYYEKFKKEWDKAMAKAENCNKLKIEEEKQKK